jgi:homospermidine synthase
MSMTHNNTNQHIDINEQAERFLDELRLNTILRELAPEQRKEYYSIVNTGDSYRIDDFVKTNIPDLENKLSERIRDLLLKEVS